MLFVWCFSFAGSGCEPLGGNDRDSLRDDVLAKSTSASSKTELVWRKGTWKNSTIRI